MAIQRSCRQGDQRETLNNAFTLKNRACATNLDKDLKNDIKMAIHSNEASPGEMSLVMLPLFSLWFQCYLANSCIVTLPVGRGSSREGRISGFKWVLGEGAV